MNVIFSITCDSRIRHRTKDRKNPIFCAVSDAAIASDTENHGSCKQTIIDTCIEYPNFKSNYYYPSRHPS
jgi:hypothetical protein